MVDREVLRRRWRGWHVLTLVALFGAYARGDTIVTQDRALLPSVLSQGSALYTFVPATLSSSGDWAALELRALRSTHTSLRYSESSTVDVFQGGSILPEGGTDQVDPFDSLILTQDPGTSDSGGTPGWGDPAIAGALSAWGLSFSDLQGDLPELALAMGSYIDYLNNTSIKLIKRLRSRLIGTASLKDTPALDSLGSQDGGSAPVARARGEGNEEAKRKEDLQTTKRVVRSVFKIILGFLLGVLLWMLVSRM